MDNYTIINERKRHNTIMIDTDNKAMKKVPFGIASLITLISTSLKICEENYFGVILMFVVIVVFGCVYLNDI